MAVSLLERSSKPADDLTTEGAVSSYQVCVDPATMCHLPPAVLVRIFSHLSVNDKCRAAQVCRTWSDLMKERCLWVDVDLRCTMRIIPVSKVVKFVRSHSLGSALKQFKCNAADNRVLEHLQEHCTNLEQLTLEDGNYRDLELELIPTAKLTHLQLRPLDADQYPEDWWCFFTPERFPVLTSLGLREPDPVDHVMREVCQLQTLRSLQLDTLPMWPLKKEAIISITNLTDLEELRLKSVYSADTTELVKHISKSLKKLRSLDLSMSEFVQGDKLGGLAELPCLESLNLSGCRRVTFRHLRDLAVHLPHLKKLHYSVCPLAQQVSNNVVLEKYGYIKRLAPYVDLYYNNTIFKSEYHQKLYDDHDAAWAELCSFRREQQEDLERLNPCKGWNSSPETSDEEDSDGDWDYDVPAAVNFHVEPSSSESEVE